MTQEEIQEQLEKLRLLAEKYKARSTAAIEPTPPSIPVIETPPPTTLVTVEPTIVVEPVIVSEHSDETSPQVGNTDTDTGYAVPVITQDSTIIQELNDTEQSDDSFIVIGGATFNRNNPIFQRMLKKWEVDAEALAAGIDPPSDMQILQSMEPHELAELMLNKELCEQAFGISNLSMYIMHFNNESARVKDLDFDQLKKRIDQHKETIRAIETLIQVDTILLKDRDKDRKEKKVAESNKNYADIKKEIFKKKLGTGKVEGQHLLSKEDKQVFAFMKKTGWTEEKARKALDLK